MLTWEFQKASGDNGNCFEARLTEDGEIEVRNSTNPQGPTVRFNHVEWRAAIHAFAAGLYDLPER